MRQPSQQTQPDPFEDEGEFVAESFDSEARVTSREVFEHGVSQLSLLVKRSRSKADSCFISHAHGKKEEEDWVVRRFVPDLKSAGIPVTLDRLSNNVGQKMNDFISEINEVGRVLIMGTPRFLEKSDPNSKCVVAKEVRYAEERSRQQPQSVIPVLQTGDVDSSFPAFLRDRIFVDLRNPDHYHAVLFDLILQLYGMIDHPTVQPWRYRLQDHSDLWHGKLPRNDRL